MWNLGVTTILHRTGAEALGRLFVQLRNVERKKKLKTALSCHQKIEKLLLYKT